ncbi:MAG TPA: hypothetical protein VI685_01165 [Candidatus Angelobacter sp.]
MEKNFLFVPVTSDAAFELPASKQKPHRGPASPWQRHEYRREIACAAGTVTSVRLLKNKEIFVPDWRKNFLFVPEQAMQPGAAGFQAKTTPTTRFTLAKHDCERKSTCAAQTVLPRKLLKN